VPHVIKTLPIVHLVEMEGVNMLVYQDITNILIVSVIHVKVQLNFVHLKQIFKLALMVIILPQLEDKMSHVLLVKLLTLFLLLVTIVHML
jgi:hypothetical protein